MTTTNDPHPTARALVEAQDQARRIFMEAARSQRDTVSETFTSALFKLTALALTAAHDAGRREGREEMRERAARLAHQRIEGDAAAWDITTAIRQLPLDDAARGEEPSE